MVRREQRVGRVAIIKPCCIGDCVMALPALDAICKGFPRASVDIFVGNHSRAVFEARGGCERILACPEHLSARRVAVFARTIHTGAYDRVIVLDRSRKLRFAAWLGAAGRSYAARPLRPETRHESEVYLDVARAAGVHIAATLPRLPRRSPLIFPGIDPATPYAVLHVGGGANPGARLPAKRWSAKKWLDLAPELVHRRLQVVVAGGREDVGRADTVAAHAGVPVVVTAGALTLPESFDLVGHAALYVGPDTGMTHVAAALGTPTVAIFGPTNPARYRPLGERVEVCAAPGSWTLPDADLRKTHAVPPEAEIDLVAVGDVLAACDRLLHRE